jgi:hypothetical protein
MKVLVILPCLFGLAFPARAEDEDLNTQLMRATVKINHDKSTATGFILSTGKDEKYVLVTAAHVFDNTPGNETVIVFRSKKAEGEYKKEPVKLVIRKDGKPMWTKHPTEDIAAIWIEPPPNGDLPKIPLDVLATDEALKKYKIHPGENLACLGFPHRNEANTAGFPILRSGTIGSFPLVPTAKTRTFLLSANVFEGDSGGPVSLSRPGPTQGDREEVRLILGLVVAQQFLDEEMKTIYGSTRIRHRLGLAIVVHASFIKETIDLLK